MKKIRTVLLIVGIILLFFSIVLSAMGAYNAHFDPYSTVLGDVDLPTALLTFFDCLFDRYLPITVTGALLTAASAVWLTVDRICSKHQ